MVVRCIEVKFNLSGTEVRAVFTTGNAREGLTYISVQEPLNVAFKSYVAGREYNIEISEVTDGCDDVCCK